MPMRRLDFDGYQRLSEAGAVVPVFREIPGDLLTPVSAFDRIAGEAANAFLLESVVGGERVARYSFLGRDPQERIEIAGPGDGLLRALRSRIPAATALVPGLPRFTGGAVGWIGWGAVRLFERIPDRLGPSPEPLASFSFYRSLVAFDHVLQRLVLISNVEPGRRTEFERAQDRIDALEADLRRAGPSAPAPPPATATTPESAFGDGAAFRTAVGRAKEHIAAGDIFQVVLSRQAEVACRPDPMQVYRALRMVNPSPYMYFLKEGERAIAGASPEMLVRVEGHAVETRPIAGTRGRGRDLEHDRALERELLGDAKERAEHLMLVDLGRNDLGRVCRFGSVTVPELMGVERYSHVQHIVSSVVGELAPGKDALDALVATFPAGTLSGAPKIRAMQIIDELEPARRGLYGGALGYIDLRGNLDFCITIRTLLLRGGRATLQAGAGIVADSVPAAEERETEAKAGALLAALELAGQL